MRVYFTVILINLLCLNLQGQIVDGSYIAKKAHFEVSNDTISFAFETNNILRMLQRGIGKYYVIDNFLIIETIDYPGPKSRIIDSISNNSENTTINIRTNNPSQNVIGIDSKGNTIKTFQVLDSKELKINPRENIESLMFSSYGYDPLTLNLWDGFNYTIEIVEGVTLENQNVVFKINHLKQTSINLTLIDIKAEDEQVASSKSLKKLKRKKGKVKFWSQTLKKD